MEGKTLKELNVQPGDVVGNKVHRGHYTIDKNMRPYVANAPRVRSGVEK